MELELLFVCMLSIINSQVDLVKEAKRDHRALLVCTSFLSKY